MESLSSYLDRKFQEIALLDSFLAFPPKAPKPDSPAAVIEQKFRLAAAIKAESLLDRGLSETARPAIASAASGPFRFRYEYQRADLRIQGPPIYPALSAPSAIVHRTIYTASGMSALAALFTALARLHDSVQVLVPEPCYSETRELLRSFGDRISLLSESPATLHFRSGNAFRVLLLDSSSPATVDLECLPATRIDLLIFDTTCYWRSSGRLRRIVNWALRAKLPLALVRSHTKLDCLGTEYGRLGSIVAASPLQCMLMQRMKWMSRLVELIDDSMRLFGLAPTIASLPPFAGDRRFHHCSNIRLAAVIRNNRRMARLLARQLHGRVVSEFQHGLYLTLTPEQHLSRIETAANAAALCKELIAAGLPVLHAGSFGFDFIAIECFTDPRSGRQVIRVAASDIPTLLIDQVAERIVRWWQRRAVSSVDATGAVIPHAAPA